MNIITGITTANVGSGIEIRWNSNPSATSYTVDFVERPTARAVLADGSTVDLPVTYS